MMMTWRRMEERLPFFSPEGTGAGWMGRTKSCCADRFFWGRGGAVVGGKGFEGDLPRRGR
jgi:hypothetical protein